MVRTLAGALDSAESNRSDRPASDAGIVRTIEDAGSVASCNSSQERMRELGAGHRPNVNRRQRR